MRSGSSVADDGFTLVEILAATALIGIALVAMSAAVQHGLSGIEIGRGASVAVFLLEDKLEELRALSLVDWDNDALVPGTTTDYCQPSGVTCSPMPAPGAFKRTTTVSAAESSPCAPRCKLVTVSVFYRPITPLGQLDIERRVDAGAMFVLRT